MRIFITGASGYIGNSVSCAFRQAGHSVQGLVRSEDHAKQLRRLEIEPVLGDMANPFSYSEYAAQAEVLVHCAFEISPNAIGRDAATIDTFINIAKNGSTPRCVLYTSGVWVYGNTGRVRVDESVPCKPIELVRWRPRHEETVLNASCCHVRTVVIRPGVVYGGSGTNLISPWFNSARQGEVHVIGNGMNHWSMIHVHDLARAYVLAAEKELKGIALNIVDDTSYTVQEMAEAVSDAAGIPKKIKYISPEEAEKQHGGLTQGLLIDQNISNDRAKRLLSWNPRHRFVDDVKLYFAAF